MKKSEWEIVDEVQGTEAPPQSPFYGQAGQADPVQGRIFMSALFGRWWKWKAAILILLASCILVVFAAFTSVVFVLLASLAFLTLAVKKLRLWLRPAPAPRWDPVRK